MWELLQRATPKTPLQPPILNTQKSVHREGGGREGFRKCWGKRTIRWYILRVGTTWTGIMVISRQSVLWAAPFTWNKKKIHTLVLARVNQLIFRNSFLWRGHFYSTEDSLGSMWILGVREQFQPLHFSKRTERRKEAFHFDFSIWIWIMKSAGGEVPFSTQRVGLSDSLEAKRVHRYHFKKYSKWSQKSCARQGGSLWHAPCAIHHLVPLIASICWRNFDTGMFNAMWGSTFFS